MIKPKRVKPLCPPDRKPRYEDVVYANVTLDNGTEFELKMDIYQNPQQNEVGPCIVYLYGGGWMWGEYKQVTQKAVYFRDLLKLVDEGYTVISPAYRLASQAIFPAAIHDCKGAIRFIKANADKYCIDPERIGVLGNSAGGHLTAMVACSANNPEIEGEVGGNLEFSSDIKAAVAYYPPTDIIDLIKTSGESIQKKKEDLIGTEVDNVFDEDQEPIECSILGYCDNGRDLASLYNLVLSQNEEDPDWNYIELAKKCSPINYVHPNTPPILVLHGGQDELVDIQQSEKFVKALTEVGAEATYLFYSLAAHGPTINSSADAYAYNFLKNHI